METLVQLGQQYKTEFEDTYEGIRRRGLEQIQQVQDSVEQIQPELQAKQEEFVTIIQDMSPVTAGYATPILETFAWTSVLLLSSYIVSLISGVILAPLVGLFIGGATAFLAAYIVLPIAFYYFAEIKFDDPTSESDNRFKILAFAIIEGALTGFLFGNRYLATAQPFTFLSPLLIAVIGVVVEDKIGSARPTLLGATVGTGVAVQLILALIARQLSFSHVLLVVSYAGIGVASLQYMFKDGGYTKVKSYMTMYGYFLAVLYAQLVVFVVFGGPKSAVQSSEEK